MRVATSQAAGESYLSTFPSFNVSNSTLSRRNSWLDNDQPGDKFSIQNEESEEDGGPAIKSEGIFKLYDALSILPSLDIRQDRLLILETFNRICTADHLYLFQPLEQLTTTDEEILNLFTRMIKWIGDLLLLSHSINDSALVRQACKFLERLAFSSKGIKKEVVRRLSNWNLMMIVMLVGLQHGVHTESFNILTCCFDTIQHRSIPISSSPKLLLEYERKNREETIEKLCSSGKSKSTEVLLSWTLCVH